MSFGEIIKNLRLRDGVSLQVVADAVESSKSHIWELEKGITKNPSVYLVTKLAKYFGTSVGYLACFPDEKVDVNMTIRSSARDPSNKNMSDSDLELLKYTVESMAITLGKSGKRTKTMVPVMSLDIVLAITPERSIKWECHGD